MIIIKAHTEMIKRVFHQLVGRYHRYLNIKHMQLSIKVRSFFFLPVLLFFFCISLWPSLTYSHSILSLPDSIILQLGQTQDEERVNLLLKLANDYQNTDSAMTELLVQSVITYINAEDNQEMQMKELYQLGSWHAQSSRKKEAGPYIQQSLRLSKSLDNQEFRIKNLIILADIKYREHKLDSACKLITESFNIVDTIKQSESLAMVYQFKGVLAADMGQFLDAIDFYLKAVRIFEERNNENELSKIYNNIAILHSKLENFNQAIYYLLKAEKLNQKLKFESRLIGNYNNFGIAYKKLDSLPQAIESYRRGIHIAHKLKDEFQLAQGFMNLANLYHTMGESSLAIMYYDSSAFLCEKNHILVGVILNKMNIGEVYYSMGRYSQGMKLLLEARELLDEHGSIVYNMELNWMLSQGYQKNGNYMQALTTYKKYVQLKDSIENEEIKSQVLGLELKFDREKSAFEIAKLQNKILVQETNDSNVKLRIATAVLLFIISGLVLIFMPKVKKYKSRLVVQENEKLRMSMELKDKELITSAIQIVQSNELVLQASKRLHSMLPLLKKEERQTLVEVMNDLVNKGPNQAWKELDIRFAQVHERFYDELLHRYPTLSPSEVRMCSYLRLNLSTKEIALLTNRNTRTIENSRSNIRKKMQLESDDNLVAQLLILR